MIAVAVAACGLQKGTHVGCSNSRVQHIRTFDGACERAAIRVRLDNRAAGVSAGTAVLPLDFTNVSKAPCQLAGYPAVRIVTSRHGKQIGSAATADTGLVAKALELPVGWTAHIWLRLFDVVNLPAALCRPVSAAGLRVALPGQAHTTFISHPLTMCTKQVRGANILTVQPFQLGQALPGTAQ